MTPNDFSMEIRQQSTCCCYCGENPLVDLTDGQLLAFFDQNANDKIFDQDVKYWEEAEINKLDTNWGIVQQKTQLLETNTSKDLKLAVTVKKLDNSI